MKFDNVNSASLFGLELEARRSISERLRLNTNFSYMFSQVNYADGQKPLEDKLMKNVQCSGNHHLL